MSESGTKAVVWRVQMTLPAVRMALKQCGSGRNRCRAAERPTTALSLLFSFSWHCENIHPSRYRVPLLCLCAHKERVKVGTKESTLLDEGVFQDHSPLSVRIHGV